MDKKKGRRATMVGVPKGGKIPASPADAGKKAPAPEPPAWEQVGIRLYDDTDGIESVMIFKDGRAADLAEQWHKDHGHKNCEFFRTFLVSPTANRPNGKPAVIYSQPDDDTNVKTLVAEPLGFIIKHIVSYDELKAEYDRLNAAAKKAIETAKTDAAPPAGKRAPKPKAKKRAVKKSKK